MINVLLVDDQALLRTGLRIIVDSEDDLTVVGEAANGQDAVRLTEQLHPDVVLMDVRMPGLDGIEATQLITGGDNAARVIILTTFDIDQYVYDGLRAGASGFLLKDSTPETLIDAIRTVAAGEAVLSPSATSRVVQQFVANPAAAPTVAGVHVLDELTEREREVFLLIARGLSNRELATTLFLAENTVKVHVARVLAKLSLRDRVQAVVLAYESGLVQPGDPSPEL